MPIVNIPVSDDQQIHSAGASYPPPYGFHSPGENSIQPARSRNATTLNYIVRNMLLNFNTPAYVPAGSIINAASFRFRCEGRSSTLNLNLVGGYYDWDGTSSDYTIVAGTNAIAGKRILDLVSTGDKMNTIPLENVNMINPAAPTKLRISVSELPEGTDPTTMGTNACILTSLEGSVFLALPGAEPTLIVDYTAPDIAPAAPMNLTATVL